MPERDLALLLDAVQEAGRIATRFFEGKNEVWDKGSDDPVSEADLAVDNFLRDALLTARPDYGWLSEETEDDQARLSATRTFVVDPIDGTRSFVAGEKTWAHSVAVVEDGKAIAGVVYLPLRNRLYSARKGGHAHLNGETLSVSEPAEAPRILAARPAQKEEHWPGGLPVFDRHFRPSLAYRMCLVAQGRFDGMVTLRDTWDWDIAAGTLIAEEAGAKVTNRFGEALAFNGPRRQQSGVLNAVPRVHDDFARRLSGTGPNADRSIQHS